MPPINEMTFDEFEEFYEDEQDIENEDESEVHADEINGFAARHNQESRSLQSHFGSFS